MEEIDNMNFADICIRTCNEESSIIFAQELGLLQQLNFCLCGSSTITRKRVGKNIGWYYRCTNKSCRKEISIKKGSFFEKSHLTIQQTIRLLYLFAKNIQSTKTILKELKIGSCRTVTKWKHSLRDICCLHFIKNPIVLGGKDVVVEIDECALVRRKYERGRLVKTQWVFGGYEVQSKRSFLVPVINRSADILIPIILNYILPESIIISDSARVYNVLSSLGYTHYSVNHSLEFVNRQHGFSINHIESEWQKFKTGNKIRYGTHRTMLEGHIGEFCWRKKFENSFFYFIEEIKCEYRFE